jgi:hypothetical protein
MHHVSLDGTGTHNGDLHHEVIETVRFQPWQHAHLCPAFHLEHTNGVGFLQHLINFRQFALHADEIKRFTFMSVNQVKSLTNAGEHAQRQHIHFHHVQGINVILVPFDEKTVLHGCRTDGHTFIQAILRKHKTSNMLREVTGKIDKLIGRFNSARNQPIAGIKPALPNLRFL